MTRSLAIAIGICLVAASVAPLLWDAWWFLELPAHFRPHTVAVAAATGVVAILCRMKIVAAACVLVAAGQLLALSMVPQASGTATAGVSIVSQNLYGGNDAIDSVVTMLGDENADIVFLQEYTPAWHAALAAVRNDDYPYSVTIQREDSFGIAVYSRLPLANTDELVTGAMKTPFLAVEIDSDGFAGHLINVHFLPPISGDWTDDRSRQLAELADYLSALDAPYVVAGDFNNTPSAPSFMRFMRATGARVAPPRWPGTWPAPLSLLAIPIDFPIASADVSFARRTLVMPVGSDHRGIRFSVSAERPADGRPDRVTDAR